jgi:hypothetical protein
LSDSKYLSRPTVVTPKIIEEGKEVVRPDVVDAVTQLAVLGQLSKIRASLARQEIEGKEDPRILEATDEPKNISLVKDFPFTPWVYAYIVNDGPDTAIIAIDDRYKEFPMGVNETLTVSRTHTDRRIQTIYYHCDPGETASIRVLGQY